MNAEGNAVLELPQLTGVNFSKAGVPTMSPKGDLGDVISDLFTEMVGGLVWRDRSQLPPPNRKTYGGDAFYDDHLAGKPVLDSLLVAERFLTVVMPATTLRELFSLQGGRAWGTLAGFRPRFWRRITPISL